MRSGEARAGSANEPLLTTVEDYEPLIGAEAVGRITGKARDLSDLHVFTKKMHNALQGAEINFRELKRSIYEEVVHENAARIHIDHDVVIVHDPQPLPLIAHFRKRAPWVWRCHVDLSKPDPQVLAFLMQFIERYDAVVHSLPEYAQNITATQRFVMPAINPLSVTNRDLSEEEIEERLRHYDIPTDLPLVVQVSRFDKWKDPEGVIEAFRIARREVDVTLVLVGNIATDDPDGQLVFESLCESCEERIRVRRNFLMTRLMEDWLDLIGSFESNFTLARSPEIRRET